MSLAAPPFPPPAVGDYAHDWALVDVETSGVIPRRDRVLSVAVVTIGADGRQTGEFSTLVNPGCDPGPVEVHGLTAERLLGAPAFEQVAERIGEMLKGRVLVAHNAQFDYEFLAHEFAHARMWLPVSQRLCTLALNRQVDPPTSDLKLGTLAAHYGVPQQHAHDALDDTRVLAGILRASLREAARLALSLPLVPCPPRAESQFTPKPPKTPCAYRNPGRLKPSAALQQGMKVAITGETSCARAELIGRGVAAGLNMMTSVSHHTSVLVTNEPASGSAKARRATTEGIPVIDEGAFLKLLDTVEPGTSHEASGAAPSVPAPRRPTPAPTRSADKPLQDRRVLVLGGMHEEAVAARTRVVELGGSAAVNLSRSVTDVVVLTGGEKDRRMRRISELELAVHDERWLASPIAVTETIVQAEAAPGEEAATGITALPFHVLPVAESSICPPLSGISPLPGPPRAAARSMLSHSYWTRTNRSPSTKTSSSTAPRRTPRAPCGSSPTDPPNRLSPSTSPPSHPPPTKSSSLPPSMAWPPLVISARSRSVLLPAVTPPRRPAPPWTPPPPNAP